MDFHWKHEYPGGIDPTIFGLANGLFNQLRHINSCKGGQSFKRFKWLDFEAALCMEAIDIF